MSSLTSLKSSRRVSVSGKFLRLGDEKFFVKGFSYGPFAPNLDNEPLPDIDQVRLDFAHMRELGANTIRIYFPPPPWLLDEALTYGLFVFVDVPWDKHRCFFEDWSAMESARQRVRKTAKEIGNHPAVLAISVVNEIPVGIVRFSGRQRVAKFVQELLLIVKQESPGCLATFANYPTTEFLEVSGCDFTCFNVYLHDEATLAGYLDRLQHIAGDKPLVLGEYGIDSRREGDIEQAAHLSQHLKQVYRHGLAGSVIFAYTDDWFTGGQQIEDWFFGVTQVDRSEKLAATSLRKIWKSLPKSIHDDGTLPRVSVVVCCYNGHRTLRKCLESLMHLDYPDYEVILVDDGSTPEVAQIAVEFPRVLYYRQDNHGLSVARNLGAEVATGEIVAYTDDDCEADEHWLRYLVQAMQDQNVDAIGGPNIPPPSDNWVAKSVAASPGGPSHVMLDDRYAEHVPGCNLAFRKAELLAVGGFDPQFRQAGDDVDVCWRLIDAGKNIGFAAGAMVWHHRRSTVRGYIKQQQGYGRSEAMVHFKHPRRFDPLGRSKWKGVIYGDGAVGLSVLGPLIYQGRFGSAPFQLIYRQNRYHPMGAVTTIEWHLVALFVTTLAPLFPILLLVSAAMWLATFIVTLRLALTAPLEMRAPWWCRPLVAWLYFIQPIVRGWKRHSYVLRKRRLPRSLDPVGSYCSIRKSAAQRDLYWDDHESRGREQLLVAIADEVKESGWFADFDDCWSSADIKLVGDCWHSIKIRTVTEELQFPRRFTRARTSAHTSHLASAIVIGVVIWSVAAILSMQVWALVVSVVLTGCCLARCVISRRNCLKAATNLLVRAGHKAGFTDETEAAGLVQEIDLQPSRKIRQAKKQRTSI